MTDKIQKPEDKTKPASPALPQGSKEIGGYKGPEPTEFGDWQHKGRVSDF